MPCHTLKLPGGGVAIACSRGFKQSPCSVPGCANRSSKLCDYPVVREGKQTTCDAKLCDRCAVKVGRDKDFCPAHSRKALGK